MRTRTITLLLAAAVSAIQIASAASATDPPLREKVGYSDLDLSNGAAVRAFYERLNVAAAHVCEPYSALDLGAFRTCVTQVLTSAVTRIRSAALTEYAATQSISPGASALRVASRP